MAYCDSYESYKQYLRLLIGALKDIYPFHIIQGDDKKDVDEMRDILLKVLNNEFGGSLSKMETTILGLNLAIMQDSCANPAFKEIFKNMSNDDWHKNLTKF